MSPSSAPPFDADEKRHLAFAATAAILCLSAVKLLVHLYAGGITAISWTSCEHFDVF